MPKFNTDIEMESHAIGGGAFNFSGARVQDVSALSSEFTLVTLVVDQSGSVYHFKDSLERCIKDVISSLKNHPRSNNLLVRLILFNSTIEEVHGFLPLSQCDLAKYDDIVNPGSATKLYDVAVNALEATCEYGDMHFNADNDVNSIVVVVTDGLDYGSTLVQKSVQDALETSRTNESLESILAILVGVNEGNTEVKAKLDNFCKGVGFDQYVPVDQTDSKTFGKVAGFISQSVSSQSQSLNSGGPSKVIPPASLGL